jgi:hypothetical protein
MAIKPSDAQICDAIRQAIARATAKLGIDRWRVELVYEREFGLKDAV